ncbi:hypothetical protein HJ057_24025 [Vibrio parahaemolyticus]|uniref:hypothetical protein n=1 Tax=Vibrio parahaemolyticus TaxID=670 RepID=UPI0015BE4D52|nr:hypothetical protein [Vibrio parahaemolyticus]EJG1583325.1 hypothetical protein [Vibrio parahaemolyticus]MBE4327852.1 hypothetical protein [Vibrio parahaemolyticus]MBM5100560.1 hypothetical protein [Vibrio parahaemolyticus]MBM5105908.1 hypothetical protein [Vibrio parahaemolyticus]QLE27430.1 hypothetical protein FDP11_18165 [Vibrio parahaemolyticus]
MSENDTVLHCGNCNQKTLHQRLSASEVEAQQRKKNSMKSQILNIVFGVLLGSHKSESQISYYKCKVCNAEHDNNESMPHGWG